MYTISELAGLAGISVRTLQYYDEIDLLKPAETQSNGYRSYGTRELKYLQQVLLYKELGYSLRQIREVLYTPGFDLEASLLEQRRLISAKRTRLGSVIGTIDRTLAELRGEAVMSDKDRFNGLDIDEILQDQKQYDEEVDRTYDPKLVAESRKRTGKYSKDDWKQVLEEGGRINQEIARLMEAGALPSDPEVQEQVKRYHAYIDRSFYSCSMEVFKGLGSLYVHDLRFTDYYEQIAAGLAAFISDAIAWYTTETEN